MTEIEERSITVADMIEALSALPPGARLVMTQSGYYCYDEYADIYFPTPVEGEDNVYSIGHSHQSYNG